MRALLLYYLKGRHDKALDRFRNSKYTHDKWEQEELWEKVIKWRNRIRRLDPDFLKEYDY